MATSVTMFTINYTAVGLKVVLHHHVVNRPGVHLHRFFLPKKKFLHIFVLLSCMKRYHSTIRDTKHNTEGDMPMPASHVGREDF